MRKALLSAGFLLSLFSVFAETEFSVPQAGNPIIPGYFADPTVKKFGDTYYIYATTDGNGGGFGPSQVWVSKDFVNWTIMPMNWPSTHHIWAPDVMQHPDGTYRFFYCEPCQIYEGVGETPRGPWKNVLGKEGRVLVPDRFVTNAITLDGQTFTDDDGRTFLYWGTWGIYKGFGCGTGRLRPDFRSFDSTRLIVNTEAHDFFEAPFVIKRDGVYYLTYSSGSCHDETYRVQYATSTVGPMGPYKTASNNPILSTSSDRTIHGPGHHSILKEGDEYYIVYHRHNIPQASRGMHRQIAADRLVFSPDNTIQKIEASHQGVGYLGKNTNPYDNLAFGKPVEASSSYGDYYKPEYAVDDNNATLWRPKTCGKEYLTVDLESVQHVERVWTQFEYATSYYQYMIEYSTDGKFWKVFSDKRDNRLAGSPMTDYGDVAARYIRLTITGNEKNGLSGGVWNIKVFSGYKEDPSQQLATLSSADMAANYEGDRLMSFSNRYGMIGGKWQIKGNVSLDKKDEYNCLTIQPGASLTLPSARYAHSDCFTLMYRIYGPYSEAMHSVVSWDIDYPKVNASVETRDVPSWHRVAWVSDGKQLRCYVDGETVCERRISLGNKPLALRGNKEEVCLTDLSLYNWKLEPSEIEWRFDNPVSEQAPATDIKHNNILFGINADDFNSGDTLPLIEGYKSVGSPIDVVLIGGRNALAFDGRQQLVTSQTIAETMHGNAPYSIEAWILNPEMQAEETVLDLFDSGVELGSVVFGNGYNHEDGIMNHNGSFENIGFMPEKYVSVGSWQHYVVTFDGYNECLYVNGRLQSKRDMVLILNPRLPASIGCRLDGDSPFTGYIHSLAAYDYVLSDEQIQAGFMDRGRTDVLMDMKASEIKESTWVNQGAWGGIMEVRQSDIQVYAGRKSMSVPVSFKADSCNGTPQCYRFVFAYTDDLDSSGIDVNGICFQLPSVSAGVWHEAILQKETDWKLYVDGHFISDAQRIPQCRSEVSLSVHGGGITSVALLSEVTVLDKAMSPAAIENDYNRLQVNSFKNHELSLKVIPLSPSMVRLSVMDKGEPLKDLGWSFCFMDGEWTKAASVICAVSKLSEAVFYVEVMEKSGRVLSVTAPKLEKLDFVDIHQVYEISRWDELIVGASVEPYVDLQFSDSSVIIGSANGNFTRFSAENGPLLCDSLSGDFLMSVKVSALSGDYRHTTPAYNEGGLMVMLSNGNASQDILQLGIFPLYDCGNMLTEVTRYGRFQYPNKLGWNYNPYLQVEREGDIFHFRTSTDGYNWTEMPSSPIERPDWRGKQVKAGIFQTTYTDNHASVTFEDFHIYQRKQ